jgi:hypothetical protein
MDVPLKFALPLLLAAALPAGFAVSRNLPALSSRVTPAPAPVQAAQDPAPDPARYQDDAALARRAAEAIAEQRARLAAAQAERDRADFELALMRNQKAAADTYPASANERREHAIAVSERMKLEGTRAHCISVGWHCARP